MAWTSADTKNYRRTLPGLLSLIYANQRSTSKTANRPPPVYSKEELKEWLVSQPNFQELWNAWVASGYNKYLSPSVDRIDNKISYTLDNIQLVSWRQNLANQKTHQKEAIHLHPASKSITQMDLDGNDLRTFGSVRIAARHLNKEKSPSNFTAVCEGKLKTAYGFRWRWT